METLQQLIDQRYENERTIEKLTEENKGLGFQIAAMLSSEGVDQAFGTQGIGYKLSKATPRYEYKPAAIEYIKSRGLAEHFIKLTQSGLKDALKSHHLSYTDMAEIEKYTVVTEGEITVRKVVDKEFTIV